MKPSSVPASFVSSGYFVSSSILILVRPIFLAQECTSADLNMLQLFKCLSSSLLNMSFTQLRPAWLGSVMLSGGHMSLSLRACQKVPFFTGFGLLAPVPHLLSFNTRWAIKARCAEIPDFLPTCTKDVYQLDFFQILEANLIRFVFKLSLFALSLGLFQFGKQYVDDCLTVFIYRSLYSHLWLFCTYVLLYWPLSVKDGVSVKDKVHCPGP